MNATRRMTLPLVALAVLTILGTVGYRVIEHASWGDALFMTFTTLSTVGYGEVFPLGPAGRAFTMALIAVGMVVVFAVVGAWVRVLFEGELENALGQRRVRKMLKGLSGHFIVCGYGRFGRRLAEELKERGEKFVVIDSSAEVPAELLSIRADATDEDVLREAGVERARVLLAALPSDADNVYVTLTAKELNPGLFVVSRCEQESGEGRLRRAGADRVVAPYAIGGHRMVELALHPMLVEFGDVVTTGDRQPVSIAEISIGAGSALDGMAGTSGELLKRYGVLPIGVIGDDGRLQVGVRGDLRLSAGTTLVVFGGERGIEAVAEAGKAGLGEFGHLEFAHLSSAHLLVRAQRALRRGAAEFNGRLPSKDSMAGLETFSFSRVTTFEQCARRYRYRYVDGVREAFQSIEAFMGQQVHASVEWLFEERDAGRAPRVEDAVRFYTEGFDRAYGEARGGLKVIKQATKVEDYRRSGAEMLVDFHRTRFVPDRFETIGLERHFVLDIDDGRRFQGFIDRLARDSGGTIHIIDYKTGGRPPVRFGGKDGDQLEAYAVAMFAETDADELVLMLEYLRNGSTQTRRIRRQEAEETARRLGARIAVAAKANVFPPTPGTLCDWCGFNDLCEAYGRKSR